MELVECVGADADGEEEREEGGDQPDAVELGARVAPMAT